MDAVLPATRLGDHDVSVGWLVEERFGREVVDRLVEPLLGGVYAGHARELSARAAVPQVVALLDRDKSMLAARPPTATRRPRPTYPVFAGITGGVGRLPAAVAATRGLDVRTGATVRDLRPRTAEAAAGTWSSARPHAPEVVAGRRRRARRPRRAATARLLADVAARGRARAGPHRVRLDGDRDDGVPRPATCPPPTAPASWCRRSTGAQVKAATYSFAKWDWVARPDGPRVTSCCVMRCSLGRHREEAGAPGRRRRARRSPRCDDLADAIGLGVRPVDTPRAAVGRRAAAVRRRPPRPGRAASAPRWRALPGLAVCGAAYDGLGIPACIASAELAATQVARRVAAHLGE